MNNEKPLISVLLPTYNHAAFVAEAIESVYAQTYENFELIVVDDASTDGTTEIVKELQKKYGFKLHLNEKNLGLIKTIDVLLSYVEGSYISSLASDDVYAPEKLSCLYQYLEENPQYCMVYSKIAIIDENSEEKQVINEDYKEGYIFDELLKGSFFINAIGTLVKTNWYLRYSRSDTYIDDLQFWLKISQECQIGFVDKVTAFYRVHNNHLASDLLKMQQSEEEIIKGYTKYPNYPDAFYLWNLRWFVSFARCYKSLAIKKFLPRVISFKSFMSLNFYKGLLLLLLPCKKV